VAEPIANPHRLERNRVDEGNLETLLGPVVPPSEGRAGTVTHPGGDQDVVVPPQPAASRQFAVDSQAQEERRQPCQGPYDAEQVWPMVRVFCLVGARSVLGR
jgi:hypothetical protein